MNGQTKEKVTSESSTPITRQGSTEKSRNLRIGVRLKSEDELHKIEKSARDCGFSTEKQSGASGYMRNVVLGYNPPSVFDQKVMIEIAKLHAHLGKIGGLFKLAISEGGAGQEYSVYAGELLKTQREVKGLIMDIRNGEFNEKAHFKKH